MKVHVDGDVWIDANGYARHSHDLYVHRTVAAQVYGPLTREAVVHHKDRNRKNNSPDNLQVCKNQAEHKTVHQIEDCIAAGFDPTTHLKCSLCKTYHTREEFAVNPAQRRGYANSCKRSFNEYRKSKGWNTGKFDERAKLLQRLRRAKKKAGNPSCVGGSNP